MTAPGPPPIIASMRPGASTGSMTESSSLLVIAVLAGLVACNRGGSEDKAAPAAEPGTSPAPGAPAVPDQGLRRRALAPIAVDEVRAALPEAGWTALAAPVGLEGTQVRATYCVGDSTLEAATAAVIDALSGAGWSNLHSREHPRRPGRYGISGQRDPFRLTAQVVAERPECSGQSGRFYTELTVHKVEPAQPGSSRVDPAPSPTPPLRPEAP